MIRFLLVLLAFVSALLAFMFQETMLFVASGGLLMVSVALLLLQLREQTKRKNRLKLPNDLTPEDELRARGVIEIRPKARASVRSAGYAPPEVSAVSNSDELRQHGILEVREKGSVDTPRADEAPEVSEPQHTVDEPTPEIPWSALAEEEKTSPPDLFAMPVADEEVRETDREEAAPIETAAESETDDPFAPQPLSEDEDSAEPVGEDQRDLEPVGVSGPIEDETHAQPLVDWRQEEMDSDDVTGEATEEEVAETETPEPVSTVAQAPPGEMERRRAARRRVEVDAHLPALQTSLGAHTICLIDVDTDTCAYRLRSIVSSGMVDNAGTEYPFAGFFLSDLLAETTVLDIGPNGLSLPDLRYHRDKVELEQVVASPVMKDGLPAAFLVAGFESPVDESTRQAVKRAADFFSSLYALQEDHPSSGDSPLTRAKRKPPSLRLVKSNPKSSQSKIIAEEMSKARGESYPLALALVCLDRGDEISHYDEMIVYQVEEWMRKCLEQITPDGRIEYLGELGYGIIQLRDVSDVEGWVRRAQQIFRSQHGPVDAHPIVGVAMLSEIHRDPEDLQADAVRALRAAYETGDSTILVG